VGAVKQCLTEVEDIISECMGDKLNLSETVEYCKQQFKKKGVYNPYLTDKKLIKKIYLSWTREVVI
tara:strand:+ start:269 stop:466 length:198 start_codon:yes stop_codon:yes gene_type:complete